MVILQRQNGHDRYKTCVVDENLPLLAYSSKLDPLVSVPVIFKVQSDTIFSYLFHITCLNKALRI